MYFPPQSLQMASPVRLPSKLSFGIECLSSKSSKKKQQSSSKRKAESINNMIRKVEQEIIYSEANGHLVELDYYHQQEYPNEQSLNQYLNHQESFESHLENNRLEAFSSSFSPNPLMNNRSESQIHSSLSKNMNKMSQNHFPSTQNYAQNQENNSSPVSSGSINIIPFRRTQSPPHQNSQKLINKENFNQQDYVKMNELPTIIAKQLEISETNIFQKVISCLKQQIVPQFESQILNQLEHKIVEISSQLKQTQSSLFEQQNSNLVSSITSYLKHTNQARNNTAVDSYQAKCSNEVKIQDILIKLSNIEKEQADHQSSFQLFKKNSIESNNNEDAQNFQQRLEKMVQNLQIKQVQMEKQMAKNLNLITTHFEQPQQKEQQPIDKISNRYQQQTSNSIDKRIETNHENVKRISNDLQSSNQITGQNQIFASNENQNVSYDILPDLPRDSILDKSGKPISHGFNSKHKIEIRQSSGVLRENRNVFNKLDSSMKETTENLTKKNAQLSFKQKDLNEESNQNNDVPNIDYLYKLHGLLPSRNENNSHSSSLNLSSEINYIQRKRLPQIFPFVESTNFELNESQPFAEAQQFNLPCYDIEDSIIVAFENQSENQSMVLFKSENQGQNSAVKQNSNSLQFSFLQNNQQQKECDQYFQISTMESKSNTNQFQQNCNSESELRQSFNKFNGNQGIEELFQNKITENSNFSSNPI